MRYSITRQIGCTIDRKPKAMLRRWCVFKMHDLKDSDFITRVREIQILLSAPVFNAVMPAPATITPMLDQLAVYVAESLLRDYRNVVAREALRAQLNVLVAAQATSVNAIAQGDVNTLLLSGFDLNKIPTPIQVPAMGEVNFVENRDGATVIVFTEVLPNCKLYEFEFFGPNGFYRYENSFYAKVKVADLPTGVTLRVKVRGKNYKGIGQWSGLYSFVVNIPPDAPPPTQ